MERLLFTQHGLGWCNLSKELTCNRHAQLRSPIAACQGTGCTPAGPNSPKLGADPATEARAAERLLHLLLQSQTHQKMDSGRRGARLKGARHLLQRALLAIDDTIAQPEGLCRTLICQQVHAHGQPIHELPAAQKYAVGTLSIRQAGTVPGGSTGVLLRICEATVADTGGKGWWLLL